MSKPAEPAVAIASALTDLTATLYHVRRLAAADLKGYPPAKRLRDIVAAADATLDRLDEWRRQLGEAK